jgi:hypothetical protein
MQVKKLIVVFVFILTQSICYASEQDHQQLRELKTNVVEAINTKNKDLFKKYIHSNIAWTLENGQLIRKTSGVDKFLEDTLIGSQAALKSYKISDVNVDEESILIADNTAISFGTLVSEYEFANGTKYKMKSRWSATLAKEDNQWKVLNFHNTVNLLDNPILTKTKQFGYIVAAGLFIIGLILGYFVRSRKK